MAQDVGDAVLKFIGDSSQLDSKFDEVTPNAEKAFIPAADVVEESTGRMKTSMYEAKGEARLLGEEFGVHLPRHVSTFIASLPGVGEALSAAFSATAIMFIAQALVQLTQKATAFIADSVIFTQAMKDRNAAIAESNKLLLEQSANYDKAKDGLEKFGAAGTDEIRLKLDALKTQIADTKSATVEGEKQNQQQRQITHEYITQTGWLSKAYDWGKSIVTGGKTQIDTIKAQTVAIQNRVVVDSATVKALTEQQALLEKQLDTEHKLAAIKSGGEVQASGAKLKAAQASAEVAEDSQTAQKRQVIAEQLENKLYIIKHDGMLKQLTILKENDENTKDAQMKLLSEMKVAADQQMTVVAERLMKAKDELQKTLTDLAKDVHDAPPIDIVMPEAVERILQMHNAAKALGITLRGDLKQALDTARFAMNEYVVAGGNDAVVLKAFRDKIIDAEKALNNFGVAEDKFKGKSDNTWKGFQQDMKNGAQFMQNFAALGKEAFDTLSHGLQSAIESVILAQGSLGAALKKATEQALASLASQAIVKALFYTAEGVASLAMFNYGSAAQYFEAAGEMAVVGAAAGIAARSMVGSGSNGNTQQQHNSNSDTGSSNRSGGGSVVGVQGFAKGALITSPTLAIIGEDRQNPTEAVLPLDDERAMGKIREGLGSNGGTHLHFHGPVIGASDVAHLTKTISRAVKDGKAVLTASNSLRLTKRSA